MTIDSKNSFLFNHISVMTDEVINSVIDFVPKASQGFIGIDATLGGGGHSYKLLKTFPDLKIIGWSPSKSPPELKFILLVYFVTKGL